jgi:hypothetical protein
MSAMGQKLTLRAINECQFVPYADLRFALKSTLPVEPFMVLIISGRQLSAKGNAPGCRP